MGQELKERMPWEVAKAAIDYLLTMKKIFKKLLWSWDFIGGEPFLEIDLIDKICDYLKVEMFRRNHHWFNSYRFSFSTNGINYGSDKVQRFHPRRTENISLSVSLFDGTKQKHDLNRIWKD